MLPPITQLDAVYQGDFLALTTLAEKVKKFSKVRLGKFAVRVPEIKPKKTKAKPKKAQEDRLSASAIVRIIIKNALEEAKRKKDEIKKKPTNLKYAVLQEQTDIPGGYGSASISYGFSHKLPYVSYKKLFSYLGQFRAKNPYESEIPTEALNILTESRSFELVSREAMDKGARHVKYFFPKAADFHVNLTSLVPVAGISSSEWEQFKLMMQLDPVMYALKSRI